MSAPYPPQDPQQQQQPQQQYGQPHAQQQYAQPQFEQQYAQPRYAPQTGYARPERVNVLGVVALSIAALHSALSVLTPAFVFRLSFDLDLDSSAISLVLGAVNLFWVLVVGVLGLFGLMRKDQPRLRWTAIGAVVSAGLGIISFVFSLFSGLLAPLFY